MIILGLDPSLAAYGWAALRDRQVIAAGCVRTVSEAKRGEVTRDHERRLRVLALRLLDVLRHHRPERVFSECPTGGHGALPLARTFGLTVACCASESRPVLFVTPAQVKHDVAGDYRAEKPAVAEAVHALCGWRSTARNKTEREAETDAVAVALTGLRS